MLRIRLDQASIQRTFHHFAFPVLQLSSAACMALWAAGNSALQNFCSMLADARFKRRMKTSDPGKAMNI